jgi:hypothetical protein
MIFIYILIVIIIIIIFLLYNNYHQTETFSGFYGRECGSCNDKNIGQCLMCNQCGVCYDGQTYKCMRGDKDGPYDTTCKCLKWLHNDAFGRYANENNWQVIKPYY